MSTSPEVVSRLKLNKRVRVCLEQATLPQLSFVFISGLLVSTYVAFGAAYCNFDMTIALGCVTVFALMYPLVWIVSPDLIPKVSHEPRVRLLKRSAFPFTAGFAIVVFTPEFLFGNPSASRVIIIVLLVVTVFVLLATLVFSRRVRDIVAWINLRSAGIAYLLVGVHFAFFTTAVVFRHVYFGAENGGDTAYYSQIFWNTLRGEFFRGSVTQERYFDPPVSTEFALHNSPVLFLVLPFYYLFPSFYTLLLLRNLLLSAGGIALFFLAREKIGGAAGLVVMSGYFLSANIVYQAINGFYPLHFIAFVLPFAFLYFFREQFWLFIVWLALTLSVREEAALTTVVFGIYSVLLRRSWQWILTPITVSIVWWYVSTNLVMVRSRIAMEELEALYDFFGGGHETVLKAVFDKPSEVLSLFMEWDSWRYMYEIVKPSGGFSLLSISSLFMMPTVIVNCIIGAFMPSMRNVAYHYSIVAYVCVFVGLINGIARFSSRSRLFGLGPRVFCLGVTLLLLPGMVLGVTDTIRHGGAGESVVPDFLPKPYQKSLETILPLLPSEAAVAAPGILMPYLAHRRKLYYADRLWRYREPSLDYLILKTSVAHFNKQDKNRVKYESTLANARKNSGYQLVFRDEEFEVYRLKIRQNDLGKHAELH